MPGIDLHTHTVYSDGTFTPTELIALARDRGLDGVAVTDPDTADGMVAAGAAGAEAGVEVVPGVELSTVRDGEGVHVLCYYMDLAHPEFMAELQRLRDDRFGRGEQMVRKLQELGYPVTFERVREIAKGGNIIRPHVAQALVEAAPVPHTQEALSIRGIGSRGT